MDFNRLDDVIEFQLLKARRLLFPDSVSSGSATDVIRKLWYLELTGKGEPITLVINSPGGAVDAGFAVWDQCNMISAPVRTLVTGMAASMGTILALVAPKGQRFATKNARFMIHQPSMGGVTGPASDIAITAEEILKTLEKLTDIYVEATGQSREVISKALNRDTWMSPEQALDFGLIDKIVDSFDAFD